MSFKQDGRLFSLNTPLGTDVLLLKDITGAEGISRLFSFQLNLLSENHSISFKDIIGKNVTISVALADGKTRYLNGIVSEFSQSRAGEQAKADLLLSYYTATVVPWLWLLTRTTDSRIFQNMTVPDIVEKIFTEKSMMDFKLKLKGTYVKREYCVQYRETDFNFISRLLEDEGIYYFFEHKDGKHTLILADDPGEHKPCPDQETARCRPHEGGVYDEDMIDTLEIKQEIRAGKYTLRDFNFEVPKTDLTSGLPSNQALGPGEREYYDYPGGYGKKSDGDTLTKVRMQEEETRITTFHGTCNCRAFTSGYRFELEDFYRDDMNKKEYVLTGIRHAGSQTYSTGDTEAEETYENEFNCIPFDVPFRPQRVTRKPLVEGVQTAIVVGPIGEEIYPDKYGRVKVQFHWDRLGKNDENSSCWIRVSQIWAGPGWGAMFIPRIGHEVIVDFLEGDPDRPIITGRVYHGNNNPPYPLPEEKTKSTVKSDTSLGGGSYNELLMEDKAGKTQVVLSNAYGHKITQDEETQTLTVETRNKNLMRFDDKNENITTNTTKGHRIVMDDKNKKMLLKTTDGYSIVMDDANEKIVTNTKNGHTILMDDKNKKVELVTTDGHSAVFSDDKQKISITSKKGHFVTIDDSRDSITLEDSSGQHRFKIDIGGSKLIVATDSGSISLEASAGKISLNAMDVEIKAANTMKLAGGTSGEFDGGAQTKVKGIQTSVEGAAMTEVKGALVKIN
jgi:type VI secretion system secreted protein VgrG